MAENYGNGKGVGLHPFRGVSREARTPSLEIFFPLPNPPSPIGKEGLKIFLVRGTSPSPPGDLPERAEPNFFTKKPGPDVNVIYMEDSKHVENLNFVSVSKFALSLELKYPRGLKGRTQRNCLNNQ